MNFIPLSYYIYSGLVNFIALFVIAVVLLIKGSRTKTNRLFSAFCFVGAFWSFFYFLFLNTSNKNLAEFYVRTCMIGVFFMPTLFIHFVNTFLNMNRSKRFYVGNYLLSIAFTFMVYSPLYAKGVSKHLVFLY